jgi:hypothetical protein
VLELLEIEDRKQVVDGARHGQAVRNVRLSRGKGTASIAEFGPALKPGLPVAQKRA